MEALAQPRGSSGERSVCVTELVHVGVHNALCAITFSYFYYCIDFRGGIPVLPPPQKKTLIGIWALIEHYRAL